MSIVKKEDQTLSLNPPKGLKGLSWDLLKESRPFLPHPKKERNVQPTPLIISLSIWIWAAKLGIAKFPILIFHKYNPRVRIHNLLNKSRDKLKQKRMTINIHNVESNMEHTRNSLTFVSGSRKSFKVIFIYQLKISRMMTVMMVKNLSKKRRKTNSKKWRNNRY